jgi:hypothetical protein
MRGALLLALLSVGSFAALASFAAFAAPGGDFEARCAAALEGALPQGSASAFEGFCRCTAGRARADGATEAELLGYATALERDPRAVAPTKLQAAAATCFQQDVDRVNQQLREDFQRTAAARNEGNEDVACRFTAWRRTDSGLDELAVPQGAWKLEIGGIACELEPARTEERLDGEIWMRDVIRTLHCPGAEVSVQGTQIRPGYTGCSYSRDGAIGVAGGATFEVRPHDGGAPVGSLMLSCSRTDR